MTLDISLINAKAVRGGLEKKMPLITSLVIEKHA